MLPSKMLRCLANAVHPAVILLWISLSWFWYLVLYLCPRWMYLSKFSIWVFLTHIGVSFSIILFLFDVFVVRPRFSLSSANSCSMCCSYCDLLVHMSLSSAKRRWLKYTQSIFKPLVSQVSRRNMFSSAAVNSLGDMASSYLTTPLVLILLLSLTVGVDFLQ